MASPDDRRYRETHEWHKPQDDVVIIGISEFAVEELTDITFIEVEDPNGAVAAGEPFGEIESVKATSELYSGIDGQIVEVNDEVLDNPAIINDDPWEKGWIIKVEPDDPSQLGELMSADKYDKTHA